MWGKRKKEKEREREKASSTATSMCMIVSIMCACHVGPQGSKVPYIIRERKKEKKKGSQTKPYLSIKPSACRSAMDAHEAQNRSKQALRRR